MEQTTKYATTSKHYKLCRTRQSHLKFSQRIPDSVHSCILLRGCSGLASCGKVVKVSITPHIPQVTWKLVSESCKSGFCYESYRLCTIELPGTMSFVGEGGAALGIAATNIDSYYRTVLKEEYHYEHGCGTDHQS